MPARTVKGSSFIILVDGKQITVKHLFAKGKRCRVIFPDGAVINTCDHISGDSQRDLHRSANAVRKKTKRVD